MDDDRDSDDSVLTSWELAAHLMHHEPEHQIDKQALGIMLGALRAWWEDDLIDDDLVEELLMEVITSYVRSYTNYFTPRPEGQQQAKMDGEAAIQAMRKMFNIGGDDDNQSDN